MMSALCSQTYKDGRTPSDREVAHMLTALLMAGQHTSSTTTAWSIMHLAHEPEIALVYFYFVRFVQREKSLDAHFTASEKRSIGSRSNTSQTQMEASEQ
jgi:cytochrome P450